MKNDRYGPNKEMKNGWLRFHTMIKPWFSMLIAIIWSLWYIPSNIQSFSVWWIAIYCTLPILPAFIGLLCLIFSGTNYKKYVNLLKISLFADLFTYAFISTVDMMEMLGIYGHYGIGWFVFVFVIGYPTWYKLNAKYFDARRVDPEAESRVMKESFFEKVDGINKRKAKEEEDEYGFRKR
jgi:hypothetical protein